MSSSIKRKATKGAGDIAQRRANKMELLQTIVQGMQQQGKAASRRAEKDRDVKVPKLQEDDSSGHNNV